MAEKLTLAELKAQNAAEEEAEQETEVVEVEEQQDAKVTIAPVETTVEEIEDEEEESAESEDVESWMQEEVATPDDGDSGFKPNREAAAVRKKLKAKLHEKDDELESLKAEIERLKSGSTTAPQTELKRPKLEDFDYDEEAYNAAMDDYYDKRVDTKLESKQSVQQQREAAERQKKALEEAVDRHYTRAAKLVEEGKVSEEKYTQADRAVRESFERIAKGNGDKIVDSLIKTLDSLGEGSEKVFYQLGVNPAKMQEVANLFATDPTGLSTVAYLGKLQASIQSPTKRKSSAPAPSPELKGSGSTKTPGEALLKRYKKAGNNVQARLDIKREAKRQGIDTRNWSD
ncbi:MAG: hypothetical protein CMK89_21480 [Pseudomonadales bacterium]|nr:hypothetical protein [Pseudomonadales bacterium]